MSIISAVFITALRSQRIIVALMAANDNTYFTLEQMAREMRLGRSFTISNNSEELKKFSFEDPRGNIIHYLYNKNSKNIKRCLKAYNSSNSAYCDTENNFSQISAANVDVRRFRFDMIGESTNDGTPIVVTFFLSIAANNIPEAKNILTHIQTTTAVRNLDEDIPL